VKAAIVDYGLCNMFSVKHACDRVGFSTAITSDVKEIMKSDVVVLPGIGAFGDAMNSLKGLDLIEPLRDVATSEKMMIGVCLGLQLLMSESSEFGRHKGLNIVPGVVKKLDRNVGEKESRNLRVPHMGWNAIHKPTHLGDEGWKGTPLSSVADGCHMYFVHSYYVVPEDAKCVLSTTQYGSHEFCSAIRHRNVFAFQFHPERSGVHGIQMYQTAFEMCAQEQPI
jgi:imidazole glycerol-phosphate synthase subunit HisH